MSLSNPVILVPGICGSSLWNGNANPEAVINKVWSNPAALALGRWRWLQLAPDGVSPLGGNPPLVPRTILFEFYAPLVDQLIERGWDVDAFWYDWRLPLKFVAPLLAAKIIQSYKGIPIHLVCHSMGGLIARLAYTYLSGHEQKTELGRVVSLGTPHWGSWEAGGGLSCRDWPTSALAGLLAALDVLTPTGPSFTLLQQVACSWPAMYQLLPSPSAPGMTIETALALYDEATWQQGGTPVDGDWMAAAFNGWQSFPGIASGVPWLSCAGVGFSTANGPDADRICPSPNLCPHTLAGDGTVPLAWAYYGPEPVLQLPLSHDLIAQDYRAVQAVDTWLRGGTPAGAAPIPRAESAGQAISEETIQAARRARQNESCQSPPLPARLPKGEVSRAKS